MTNIIVYSTKNCPRCSELKAALKAAAIAFEDVDMSDPANMTDLRINGVFTREAPVLQVGNIYYTANYMFGSGKMKDVRELV